MKGLMTKYWRSYGGWLIVCVVLLIVSAGCTTTERAARLVIDHHIGMAQGAMDIMSGKAEEREQRVARLQQDLETNRIALAAEPDPGRAVDLLRHHIELQDALIAELVHGHAHHGAQQGAKADNTGDEPAVHQH